jgi:hypothetical protein
MRLRVTRAIAALAALLSVQIAAAQMPGPAEMQQLMEQLQQDPAQVQRLMDQAQSMQACMAQIDEPTLERLRARGEAMGVELQTLCANGRRDEASNRALGYAREMSGDPAISAIESCGELARQFMADLPFALPGQTGEHADAHVCDQLPQ